MERHIVWQKQSQLEYNNTVWKNSAIVYVFPPFERPQLLRRNKLDFIAPFIKKCPNSTELGRFYIKI